MARDLDHILMGAPELEDATAAFASLAGIAPAGGGSHPGFGTRNQLLSLGEGLFFEIIAPDPAQSQKGQRADGLEDMAAPAMLTFCMRSDDLPEVAERAKSAGLTTREPVTMSRIRADGVKLKWEILYIDAPDWGDAMPFFIDWKGSPHPAETAPGGCTLRDFMVLHPNAADLNKIYDQLGIPVSVKSALSPGFILRLDTPSGEVVLT